ncbi:MAG: PQQ-binding-like beta-propeller repeat protein [Kofleriaceae bacterium]
MRSFVVLAAVLGLTAPASARTVHGLVFEDRNGDGVPSIGEPGVPGAIVALGVERFVAADQRGEFTLEVVEGDRSIAWVRVPDGFVPGPVWRRVDQAPRIDLALRPLPAPHAGPVSFVVASDTHISPKHPFGLDLDRVLDNAIATDQAPAFFTILGDLTQGNGEDQFDLIDAAVAQLDVPFIPVPGNHDWYDGGEAWFARFGPDNYSFDIGTVHFVVWNMAMAAEDIAGYLGAELERVAPGMTVVAMTHAPPAPDIIDVLRDLGVDYLLTGHTHSNRVVDHGGLLELATEPLLMGGLDFTPAGYRVVTIDRGLLTAYHRSVVEQPFVSVIAPAPHQCTGAGHPLIVAAELDAGSVSVTAQLDCGTPVALRYAGGWSWRTDLPPLSDGAHTLRIEAQSANGEVATRTVAIEACSTTEPPAAGEPWPQLGGNSGHTGARATELAPPLQTRWTNTVGGHILHSAPVIADGAVYAVATDLGEGAGGGVVSFELATGALRWRVATPMPVRTGPVVVGDVVVAAQIDGTVVAIDAARGELRWQYELGGGDASSGVATFAPAAIDGDEILIGNERRVAAIEAATGAPARTIEHGIPSAGFPTLSSPAIGDGISVGVFDRAAGGVVARDRMTGKQLWRLEGEPSYGIHASPVIAGDVVFLASGPSDVIALEAITGAVRWTVKLDPGGFEWGNAIVGTPAIAGGILVVPTLYRDLVGLEASTGTELWRFAGTPSPLRTTHYRGAREAGFAAAPVITGGIVWAADTAGVLSAIELRSGRPLWTTELGAPVFASLAVSGDWMIVGSYDGTVHALTRAPSERPPAIAEGCEVIAPSGCCDASGHPGAPTGSLGLALATYAGLRRRRGRISASKLSPIGSDPPAAPPVLHA